MLDPEALGSWRDEPFGIAHLDTVLEREFERAAGDEHGQGALQDLSRQKHGVRHSGHGTHRSGVQPGTVHHAGIALHPAIPVQERPVPGVEGLVVLEHDHGPLGRVEGGPSQPEHLETNQERPPTSLSVGLEKVRRQEAGSPVYGHGDHPSRPQRGRGGHPDSVSLNG